MAELLISNRALARLSQAFRSDPVSSVVPTPVTPTMPTEAGVAIDLPPLSGRYKLLRVVGGGGMGTVYHARDLETGADVAVKVPYLMGKEVDRRFVLETTALEAVVAPSILGYLGSGSGELPYLVTELVRGTSLAKTINARGPMDEATVLAVLRRLTSALAAVHANGWVHRDVKPGNVIVTDEGDVRLIDFGLARPLEGPGAGTKTGRIMGTLSYLAPEQLAGEHVVDARTDVFALGCIGYECRTATNAFRRLPARVAAGDWSLEKHPVLPATPEKVGPVLATVLPSFTAIEPQLRPRDALAALAELLSADAVSSYPKGMPASLRDAAHRAATLGQRRPVTIRGVDASGKTTVAIAAGALLSEIFAPADLCLVRCNPMALGHPGAHAAALERVLAARGYRNAPQLLAGNAITLGIDDPALVLVLDDVEACDTLSLERFSLLAQVGLARLVTSLRHGATAPPFEMVDVTDAAPPRATLRPFDRWILRTAAMFGAAFPISGVARLVGGDEATAVPGRIAELCLAGELRLVGEGRAAFISASLCRDLVRTTDASTLREMTRAARGLLPKPIVEATVIQTTSATCFPASAASP
jgi:hypothetical protein